MPQRENVQQLFESMAGNAYVFGREWISKKVGREILDFPFNFFFKSFGILWPESSSFVNSWRDKTKTDN